MSDHETTHFGGWIRGRREERGLSLEEVSSRIRIDVRYLEALETGNIALLPEPYMRAFLKTYASFLGLDGAEASRRFEAFIQGQREQEEQVRSALKEKDSRRGGPAAAHEPAPHTIREAQRSTSSAWLWALGVIVLFAAAGYLGWILTVGSPLTSPGQEQTAQPPEQTPPVSEQEQPQEEQEQPQETEVLRPPATPIPEPAPAGGEAVFEAVAVDSTWIQAAWGGTVYVSRVVPPGGRVRVPVADTLEVVSGRSGGMRYYFGGEEIAPVWPEGRVLTLLLTQQGVAGRRWSLPPDQPLPTAQDSPNIPLLP